MTNSVMLVFAFFLILLIIRGYMGLTLRLILSKKERKCYQCQFSQLNRWFFGSVHKIIKDKYSKHERKTIRYSAIFGMYKVILSILHIELIAATICVFLSISFEYFQSILPYCCGLYIISAVLSFVILAMIEVFSHPRYHKNRYK